MELGQVICRQCGNSLLDVTTPASQGYTNMIDTGVGPDDDDDDQSPHLPDAR